jgi:hypothetical protein
MFAVALWLFYVGATHPPHLHSPPWIMYVLGVIFFAGGVRILEIASGRAGPGQWMGFVFCAGMATVFAWIPFGGDPHSCSSSVDVALAATTNLCQIAFGAFSLPLAALAIYIARRWLSGR